MFKNYMDSFVNSVTNYPDKAAIIFGEQTITYNELHHRSNNVAHRLMSLDVKSEQIIPLILERDPNTIISIIGILKAGCAFLPISPITPCARIQFLLEDTKATCVISNMDLTRIVDSSINIINPSEIISSDQTFASAVLPSNLAYTMYTSGSTGNPKGVLIEHGSMMNLFSSLISKLDLQSNETFLALTDYTFDISLIELLMPLLLGATIILTEQGTVADGVKIKHYTERYPITLMQATPLTWEILIKQGWKNDGTIKILVGGEKFRTRLAEQLNYKHGNIWNVYGPTETSMWSMYYHVTDSLITESVPLGLPLDNTIIEILDEDLNRVKCGSQGELYIGGLGLARGYLNNPELTQKQFIYHTQTQTRLYRTGDLVILHDEETLCYTGRADDQLKFGGIRIEAGEIESVLEQEPFVKKAIVKVHETEGYYKSLAAYIEIDEDYASSLGTQAIRTNVSDFLKNIYDETYMHAEDYEHGIINNCGWQSSFTGQLMSVDELNESYQFIRSYIKAANLNEVLEVGCGTGALLLEYIDDAKLCTIVEISAKAIDYVKRKLSAEQKDKITFRNESVLTIHNHKKYTCVIVNSVIQYLSSVESVVTALTQLIAATQDNGTIIIGDVRALELMDLYLLERIRTNSSSLEDMKYDLSSFYYKSRDAEVLLSPHFFLALKEANKEITHVDICVKHGDYNNELNYFRYDVILHINKPVKHVVPVSFSYAAEVDSQTVQGLINQNPNNPLIVRNIPNLFLHDLFNRIHREVSYRLPISVHEQKVTLTEEVRKNTELLLKFKPKSHECHVLYGESSPNGELEIHFYPKEKHELIRFKDTRQYQGYRAYSREPFNPWLQKFYMDHIKLKVRQHVLSWVNPSVYIWIEKWPLTINGKMDKKQLQLPPNTEHLDTNSSTLEQLQAMWRNITGDNALVDKEFWVHGVSSLCMYFFLATINETFLVNINYHEFHDYNTLDKLAEYIEQLLELTAK